MQKEWLAWQREIIRSDEYKDILPARDNSQRQVERTVKETLPKVKEYVR